MVKAHAEYKRKAPPFPGGAHYAFVEERMISNIYYAKGR